MSGQVPTLGEFEAEVLDFLDRSAPARREAAAFTWGAGSDRVALFGDRTPAEEADLIAAAREWRRTVFDAGFGWISGPIEYGGRGLPPAYTRAWHTLERRYDIPPRGPFNIGLGMVAPTIQQHGTATAKSTYLRALYRGDVIACQLFSEPEAGSDLASVRTSATRDGSDWRLCGEKVWTSGAHYSDIGLLLARTSPGPRHKNLTVFLVDMHSPGVTVRPLRQMTGGATFSSVELAEVAVDDEFRLGAVDEGWRVALTTLMNERSAAGASGTGGAGLLSTARLVSLAQQFGAAQDPVARQRIADIYIRLAVARYTRLRSDGNARAGRPPGPEMAMSKLSLTQSLAAVSSFVSDVLGPRVVADAGEWGTYAWSEFILGVPGMRLGGGTDEVLRNVVAERVLGLPSDRP